MTRRIGLLIAGLLATVATATLFATPVIYAGIAFNGLD